LKSLAATADAQQPQVPPLGGGPLPILESVVINIPPDGAVGIRGFQFKPNSSVRIRVSNADGSFRNNSISLPNKTDANGIFQINQLNIGYPGLILENLYFAATDGRAYQLDWTGQLWTRTFELIA
jgi:hypothetical protein